MTANYKDLICFIVDVMHLDLLAAGKRSARFLKNHGGDYQHTKEAIHFYINTLIQRHQYNPIDDVTVHISEILAYVDELYGKGAQ